MLPFTYKSGVRDAERRGHRVAEEAPEDHHHLVDGDAESDEGDGEPDALLPRRLGLHGVADAVDAGLVQPAEEGADAALATPAARHLAITMLFVCH